jgi:hypothetical protein
VKRGIDLPPVTAVEKERPPVETGRASPGSQGLDELRRPEMLMYIDGHSEAVH